MHHHGQRHQAAIFGAHILAVQRRRRQALVLDTLRDHIIGAPEQGKAVEVLLAHQHPQRLANGLHADAQAGRLGPVDAHLDHRVVVVEVAVHHGKQAAVAGALLEHFHGLVQLGVILGAAQHHLHRQAATGARQRSDLEGEDAAAFDIRHGLLQLRLHLCGGTLARLPGAEVDTPETGGRAVGAVDDPGVGGFGDGLHHLVELQRKAFCVFEAGMLRRLDGGQHRRLVLGRRQLALGQQVKPGQAQAHQQRHTRADPAMRQGVGQHSSIGRGQRSKQPISHVGHRAMLLPRLQQQRAHHRRQGQRHDAGHDHRPRQGQGKFAEQRAGQPAHQPDRRIHRRQGQGHGNHRPGDFPCPDQCRSDR